MVRNRNAAIYDYVESLDGMELNSIMDMLGCDTNEFSDLVWYPMVAFNIMCGGMDPIDIANVVSHGDFDTNHDWFRYDSNGNLESADTHDMIHDCFYWWYDIATYLVNHGNRHTDTGDTVLNSIVHAAEETMFKDDYTVDGL